MATDTFTNANIEAALLCLACERLLTVICQIEQSEQWNVGSEGGGRAKRRLVRLLEKLLTRAEELVE